MQAKSLFSIVSKLRIRKYPRECNVTVVRNWDISQRIVQTEATVPTTTRASFGTVNGDHSTHRI